MAEAIWNFRNAAHRDRMGELIAPLIVASRSRDFIDEARAKDQLIAWCMSLKDVSEVLLEAGVQRLMARGLTWMPRPGDLREACCDIVDERRKIAAQRAAELAKDCARCDGTQWEAIKDEAGVERVQRCWCFTRGLELVQEAGSPLTRPSLPAAKAEESVT